MVSIRHNGAAAVEGYAVQVYEHEVRLRILGDGEALYARYNGQDFEIYPRFVNEHSSQRFITIASDAPLEAWADGARIGVFSEFELTATKDGITLAAGAEALAHYRDGWTWSSGELGPLIICNPGYMFGTVPLVPTVRGRVSSLALDSLVGV